MTYGTLTKGIFDVASTQGEISRHVVLLVPAIFVHAVPAQQEPQMTSVDINYFDILSNELIAEVVNFLDLQSLFRLASTCNRLCEFKEISNEQWRRYYSQKWLVDERELAIYTKHNWQQLYHDRFKLENDYLVWIKSAQSESEQSQSEESYNAILDAGVKSRIVPQANGVTHDTYYKSDIDPWAILLQANLGKINPPLAVIKACLRKIAQLFHLPFERPDQEREIMSGRFEIVVTTVAKFVTEDITMLAELGAFQQYFSDDYKNLARKMPIGLLGLLTKYLDLTLAPELLSDVVNRLWEAAASKLIDEDMFVGLGIISKLIHVLLKGTNDDQLKYACFFIITWFYPSKAQNKKVLVNAPFTHFLIDQLSVVPAENVRWVLQLLSAFADHNGSVVNETRLVHRLMDFIRDTYRDNEMVLPYLLNAVSDICLSESNNACIELAQSESELEYLLSLIRKSDDEDVKRVAQRALNVIDTVVRNENGAVHLLEMNALDRLLPFIEDPTNTHLFKNLYYTFKYMTSFGEKNGLGDEIFPKLLKHQDALLERGYGSNSDGTQAACDEFWMTFSCMTTPPRDVSIKLIDRALPLLLNDETKLRMKIDATILLANLVEIDIALFENKWLTPLFNTLAEYLINFDPEKEYAELNKNKKAKKEITVTLGETEKDGQDENNQEGEIEDDGENENDEEDDGELEDGDDEEDGEDDENEDEENEQGVVVEVNEDLSAESEEVEEDEFDANESPWPLNLLAQIIRFDYIQDVAIQNEQFIDKLFAMLEDEALEFEGHFLSAYTFSLLIHKPGWDSAKALQYIEDFAIECEYDVEWSFIFALLEPYLHLLRKDNPEPLTIFGSWFLAHMSTLEPGRQILKKDLDPSIVTCMKSHPHARVQHNINQFTRNMQKKSRRKQ